MDYQTFKTKLKECNLNIKEFAEICGLNPKSISITWKSKNETPKWVEVLLDNYITSQSLNEFCEKFCKKNNPN